MNPPLSHAQLYHTGTIVHHFGDARREYSEIMGVTWGREGENDVPVWFPTGPRVLRFRFAYTSEGPHRIELIGSIEGTLWEAADRGRPHHFGFWADDVEATSAQLAALGLPLCAKIGVDDPDTPAEVVYHQAQSGAYIELVAARRRSTMFGADD